MNSANTEDKRPAVVPWWIWILMVNVFLIIMTALFPYVIHDFLRWNVINHFNLAGEMTFAAWWSGILLLWAGILAYDMSRQEDQTQRAWGILALLFVLLSFDEIGSLHERASNTISGTIGLQLAAIIGGGAFLYACWLLWQHCQDRKGIVLLLLGGAMMASAALHEYLEHNVHWPFLIAGARVALEEGSELTGMLLSLVGLVRLRSSRETRETATYVLPNPCRLSRDIPSNVCTLVLHLGVSIWVTRYVSIEFRGNPAVFYFMATFFLLGLAYCWRIANHHHARYYLDHLAASYFIALSIGSMYFILPRFNSRLHALGMLADVPLLLALQLPLLVTTLLLLNGRLNRIAFTLLIVLVIALGVGWVLDSSLANYVVSGLFAWVVANLFWPQPSRLFSAH